MKYINFAIMKKIFLLALSLVMSTICYAQYVTVDELNNAIERQMKSESTDFDSFAKTIMEEIPLDNNGGFTYVNIVEASNKTKEQLYIILNAWFLQAFNGKGMIINDKDLGCIMAKESIRKIASNGTFTSSNKNYEVDIEPTIRTDIKDGKVRITFNVPNYEVRDVTSSKWGKQAFAKDKSGSRAFLESYPYNPNGKEKKMMSRALVFTHSYSIRIIADIEKAIINGVAGNEADDDW